MKVQRSERDGIRLGAVMELICSVAGDAEGPYFVDGSTALLTHFPDLTRTPNDVDLVRARAGIETLNGEFAVLNAALMGTRFRVKRPRRVNFFRADPPLVFECHCEQWESHLRDAFPVSIKPLPADAPWTVVSGIRVIPADVLLANKFHALFKPRDARVSSRSRDLVDLFTLHKAGFRAHLQVGSDLAMRTWVQLAAQSSPPTEWARDWDAFRLSSGVEERLQEAWNTVGRYVR
jgi:hypothetical protein